MLIEILFISFNHLFQFSKEIKVNLETKKKFARLELKYISKFRTIHFSIINYIKVLITSL